VALGDLLDFWDLLHFLTTKKVVANGSLKSVWFILSQSILGDGSAKCFGENGLHLCRQACLSIGQSIELDGSLQMKLVDPVTALNLDKKPRQILGIL
jgi:hypothetical protein